MQAITTKYLGPTNTKPSRIVGRAGGVCVTMSPSDSTRMLHEDIHSACAKAVAEKLGWSGHWVGCWVKPIGWIWISVEGNGDTFTVEKGE